ncbi:TB2/DP1, HVA22 family-domain-containing protein [Phascolomyces articulosus]|uniref:Protein YOP1 n=1 Tax=Phascolomyces articulosus TaxID=60185 RepID=A0AAD5KQS4_9FUNG|nr:TB2/DP1, HVA22 family-domain-containing protein [Phascolomyces articulosus]
MYFLLKLFLLQIYPAYTCFKAIKVNDQTQFLPLLMYWVTATTFLISEYFADLLLFWIPFYSEFKLLVVLWITLPQTKGAIVVYADFIEPFLKQHENRIDKAFIEIQEKAKHTASIYGKQLLHIVNKLLADLFNKVYISILRSLLGT